jgi:aryl-alcohol dehydrogenase-like predicted oxidoreductase
VSAVALGVMTFGAKTAEADAFRQLDLALAAGINLFDTAENYPAPKELMKEIDSIHDDVPNPR